MHVCPEFVSVHQCPQTSEEGLGLLELELQMASMWMLGIEPESSARAVNVLNTKPPFQPLVLVILKQGFELISMYWGYWVCVIMVSLPCCIRIQFTHLLPKTHIPKDVCVFHFLTHAFNPSTYEV